MKAAKNRNEGSYDGGFGLQTEKVKGEMMVQNTNKAMSEIKVRRR